MRTPRWSARFAGGSTACRWRSSSSRLASRCSGSKALHARLDDSLPRLGSRLRTAMPRHQTMRAVIDWSYGLLSEDEQQFFRALGSFAGVFTAEAAAFVAMDAAPTGTDSIDRLADL